jgi:hypothetical protein
MFRSESHRESWIGATGSAGAALSAMPGLHWRSPSRWAIVSENQSQSDDTPKPPPKHAPTVAPRMGRVLNPEQCPASGSGYLREHPHRIATISQKHTTKSIRNRKHLVSSVLGASIAAAVPGLVFGSRYRGPTPWGHRPCMGPAKSRRNRTRLRFMATDQRVRLGPAPVPARRCWRGCGSRRR